MISIDITFVIQLMNFLVSLCIINFLIIKPIRANMAKRNGMTDDDIKKAKDLTEKADIQFHAYEERLQKVRLDIAQSRIIAKESGEKNAQEMLSDSEKNAHAVRTEASIHIKEESDLAQKELERHLPQFVQLALTKIFA